MDITKKPRGWNLRKGAQDYGKIDHSAVGKIGGINSAKSPNHKDFSNNPERLKKSIETIKSKALPKPE